MKERVKNLLEHNDDIAIWFQLLCENGAKAIEAQAWQIADVMQAPCDEVRDAMLEVAHELLPDSPAGEDPHQLLFREAGIWASRQPQDVQKRLAASFDGEEFEEAWGKDLGTFRRYLRERCRAAIRSPKEAA